MLTLVPPISTASASPSSRPRPRIRHLRLVPTPADPTVRARLELDLSGGLLDAAGRGEMLALLAAEPSRWTLHRPLAAELWSPFDPPLLDAA